MGQLWHKYNVPFPLEAALPEDWAVLQQHGDAIAGTPAQVRDYIAGEIAATGVNYYVCDFAFGTISHDEAMRSIELFTRGGDAGLRRRLIPSLPAPACGGGNEWGRNSARSGGESRWGS